MQLVIDARKAFDSGIGTYIRSVVPRVARLLEDIPMKVLVARGTSRQHAYLGARQASVVEVDAGPLTLPEQIELRRHLNRRTMFWATSLAHPLFTRLPLVATVHDVAQLALADAGAFPPGVRMATRVYLASVLRRARVVLVNSEFTRSEFAHHVGSRTGQPVCVTPLGVEPEWFDVAAPVPEGSTPYFVCVGNVRAHKNLRTLVQAFERIAAGVPHQMLIIGAGSGAHLGQASSRMRFTGFLPDAELRRLVAGAQALVFPSLYEGFGLPALEAMAAGCPVIASNAAALPEVCADAAVYFDPRSVDDLAARLQAHANLGPDLRAAIVDRGRAHARSHTWDRTASLTAEAIRQAIRVASDDR